MINLATTTAHSAILLQFIVRCANTITFNVLNNIIIISEVLHDYHSVTLYCGD